VGRRLEKSNIYFSVWCDWNGFGDMDRRVRADAMWMAALSVERTTECPISITSPTELRRWFNENLKSNPELPSELSDLTIEPVAPSVTLDTRSAVRLAKVNNRAKDGGEGSTLAKKHFESIARKHGVTAESYGDRNTQNHSDVTSR
jgi:hypothetical protein